MTNEPISEQYRLKAQEWVDADSAANILEESKSAVMAQKMAGYGDIPVSKAELYVKSSQSWRDYLEAMVNARTKANHLKVEVEYIRMRYFEEQGMNANRRVEMRL